MVSARFGPTGAVVFQAYCAADSTALFREVAADETILLAAGAGLEGVTDVSPASQHLVLSAKLYKGTIVFPGEDNGQEVSSLSPDEAALRIQAQARRREAAKRVEAIKRDRAAAKAASPTAAAAAAAAAPSGGLTDDAAATLIQSQARRLEAAKRVEALKAERAAAAAAAPPSVTLEEAKAGGLSEDEAAVLIQAQARRLEAAKRVEALKAERAAAAAAAAGITESAATTTTASGALTEDEAALRIQAQARRLEAAKRVEQIRRERAATARPTGPVLYSHGRNLGAAGYALITARLVDDGTSLYFVVFDPRSLLELTRALDLTVCAAMASLPVDDPLAVAADLCARLVVRAGTISFVKPESAPAPAAAASDRITENRKIGGVYFIVTVDYSSSSDAYEVSAFDAKTGTTHRLTVSADEAKAVVPADVAALGSRAQVQLGLLERLTLSGGHLVITPESGTVSLGQHSSGSHSRAVKKGGRSMLVSVTATSHALDINVWLIKSAIAAHRTVPFDAIIGALSGSPQGEALVKPLQLHPPAPSAQLLAAIAERVNFDNGIVVVEGVVG